MVSYYLLRDNQEQGPFTRAELKEKTLFTTDLIWVDGESTYWKHPSEIPELSGIPLTTKAPQAGRSNKLLKEAVSACNPDVYKTKNGTEDSHLPKSQFEVAETPPSFEALKEKYAQKLPQKRAWTRHINIGANLLGLTTLFVGLGLSAYMIKKAVENIEYEPIVASAEAIEIKPEKLHSSTATHAAFAGVVPSAAENSVLIQDTAATRASGSGQSGLASETAKQKIAVVKRDQASTANVQTEKENNASDTKGSTPDLANSSDKNAGSSPESSGAIAAAAKEESIAVDSKAETEEKAASKPSLQLSANKYNVGFLGGISNLQLFVNNPSAQEISKAIVEVEYLRPNGKVIESQTISVIGIAPGSSKSVSVPDNSRGVSVRYKVVKIES